MRIRIRKVADGVTFVPVTQTGEPSRRPMGGAVKAALQATVRWWREGVRGALDERGMGRSGYAHVFEQAYARASSEGLHVQLEPVGFAIHGRDGEPDMNDCGSTPTPGRARVLACYQARLFRRPSGEPGRSYIERFVMVEAGRVVPEGRPKVACHCRCPGERDEHDHCARCGGVVTARASCAVEA